MSNRKTGVWLIGACGAVSTLTCVGARAIARGFKPPVGLLTETPLFDGLDLPELDDLVFGGHEIRDTDLHCAAHEFADRARQYCPWSRARYRMLRDRGMKHHAALRKIARSWIRILFRVWKTRVPFDCDRYIAKLQQRCPEIIPYLEQKN